MDTRFGQVIFRIGIFISLFFSVSTNHINGTGHDTAGIRSVVETVIKDVLAKTFGNNTYGTMPDISELTKAVMLSKGYPMVPAGKGVNSIDPVTSATTKTTGNQENVPLDQYGNTLSSHAKQMSSSVTLQTNNSENINVSPSLSSLGLQYESKLTQVKVQGPQTSEAIKNGSISNVQNVQTKSEMYVTKSETLLTSHNDTIGANNVNSQPDQNVTSAGVNNGNGQTTQNVKSKTTQLDNIQTAPIVQQDLVPLSETTAKPTFPTTSTYLTTQPTAPTKQTQNLVSGWSANTEKVVGQVEASQVNTNSHQNIISPEIQTQSVQYSNTQQIINSNSVTEAPSVFQPPTQFIPKETTQIETSTTRVAGTTTTASKVINITSNPGKAYQEYNLKSSVPSTDPNQIGIVSLIEPHAPLNNYNPNEVSVNANIAPPLPKANILARLLSKLVGVNATEMDFFNFHNLLHHHPHVEPTTTTTTTTTPVPTTTVSVLKYLLRDDVIAKLIQRLKLNNVNTHAPNDLTQKTTVNSNNAAVLTETKQSIPIVSSGVVNSNQTAPNGVIDIYPSAASVNEIISGANDLVPVNTATVSHAYPIDTAVDVNTNVTQVNTDLIAFNEATNASSAAFANETAWYFNANAAAADYNANQTANTTYETTTGFTVTTMDPDMVAEMAEMAEAEAELRAEAEAEAAAEAEAEAEAAAEEPAV